MQSLFSIALGLCSLGNNDQSCVVDYIECAEKKSLNWARPLDDKHYVIPLKEFYFTCVEGFKKESPKKDDGGFGTKEF